MINNRTRLVQVCRKQETMNELNERVSVPVVAFTVDMAISLNNGQTQNVMNVLAAHSTHTGITRDDGITMEHLIKDGSNLYAIDYLTDLPRIHILNLRLIEELK